MSNETEMPRYRCHKEVHALEIAEVRTDEDGNHFLVPKDKSYSEIFVRNTWYSKHSWASSSTGGPIDLRSGYYVVYANSYASWSPKKVFEEGYTRL
jgi:hypothetical protein